MITGFFVNNSYPRLVLSLIIMHISELSWTLIVEFELYILMNDLEKVDHFQQANLYFTTLLNTVHTQEKIAINGQKANENI